MRWSLICSGFGCSATGNQSPTTSGSWASHQTISDPQHVEAAKRLRRERIGVVRPVPEPDVEIRCLADYDDALGVDDVDGVA